MSCPECKALMVRSKVVDGRWICAESGRHDSRKVLRIEFIDPLEERG